MADSPDTEHRPVRVTADGRWLHGDTPIQHKVVRLFQRSLVPLTHGGYLLQVGRDRSRIQAADTPYFVHGLSVRQPNGSLHEVVLTLSDGEVEPLNPATLEISDESVLYCRIARYGLLVPCRFPPSLYHRLALHVEEAAEGFVLPLGGRLWPIRRYAAGRPPPAPRPTAPGPPGP